jgi:hypothetical protein
MLINIPSSQNYNNNPCLAKRAKLIEKNPKLQNLHMLLQKKTIVLFCGKFSQLGDKKFVKSYMF